MTRRTRESGWASSGSPEPRAEVAGSTRLPWFLSSGDGVRIRVRAVPGASRDAIAGCHGEALRVQVRAVPERGRANEAICDLVAERAGLAGRSVSMLAGHAGRDKILVVRGVDAADLAARLAGPAGPPRAGGR